MMHRRFESHSNLRASLWPAVVLSSALAIPFAAQQSEKESAKAIFYKPSASATGKPDQKPQRTGTQKPQGDKILVTRTQTAPAKNPALHYWFELESAGKVSDDRVFYTGERISLHVRGNIDGHLTLWACDSSGHSQLLFPPSTASEDGSFVSANTEYTLGVIELSPPAEDERLLIFFSESKDDIPSPQQASLTDEQIKQATQAAGMLFEMEKKDPATFGSYIANRQGGAIAKEIRLKHRPRKKS